MLPLMKAGVLAMKGLNLAAKVAPMMFGIPPGTVPSIPPASMAQADQLIQGMEAESEDLRGGNSARFKRSSRELEI